jgi:hypothetical protein
MSNDKKLTAVDWIGIYIKGITTLNCEEVVNQAKTMQREQLVGLLEWMNEVAKEEPMRLETDADDIVDQYMSSVYL